MARLGGAALLVAASGCDAGGSASGGAASGSFDAAYGDANAGVAEDAAPEDAGAVGAPDATADDAQAADALEPGGPDAVGWPWDVTDSSDQTGGRTPDAAVMPGDLQGGVLIFEVDTGSVDYDRGNAVASFGWAPDLPLPVYSLGPCDIFHQGQAPEPEPPSADAGVIEITGTAIPVELQRSPEDGVYRSSLPDTNAEILSTYDTPIHVVSIGGADVPPFSGDLPTPAAVQITKPSLGLTSFVSTSEPMPVGWSADSPGKVARTLITVSPVGFDLQPIKGEYVLCTVAGDATEFTVPQEAMAALPSSFGTRLVVSVTRVVEAHVDAGGVPVTLAATASFGGVASAK